MHSRTVTLYLKIMFLLHEFLHELMSLSRVELHVRIWTVQFIALLWICYGGKWKKNNDWNKRTWIINTVVEWRWWRRVGLIELQEDCQCQEITQFFSFKKQAGTFYITEIMWLGQVCLKFQLVILCLFLKEDLKLDKFHCLSFLFNPSITEQRNFLLLWNWAHIVPIFLRLFSRHFFSRFD